MKTVSAIALIGICVVAVACGNHPKSSTASASLLSARPSSQANCIFAHDPEKAFLLNVDAALAEAGYLTTSRRQVVKTVSDDHDPVYLVTFSGRRSVHVTCDDSGDGQCECEVAP